MVASPWMPDGPASCQPRPRLARSSTVEWGATRTGDRVGIRGTRFLGTVVRVEGEGQDQQFTLHIFAPPDPDPGASYELAQAAKVVRTVYRLAELEPHP